jgi:hypothetical protein
MHLEQLTRYGVSINADWGWIEDWMTGERFWQSGSWELYELDMVLRGVMDLAQKLLKSDSADAFREHVGPVEIQRSKTHDFWYVVTQWGAEGPISALWIGLERRIGLYNEWANTRSGSCRDDSP